MTTRVYNFCAGPATMPEEVLRQAREELLDYRGCGASIMEISHRSPAFDEIVDSSVCRVRRILSVPDQYSVLFLAGGATYQFSQLAMNLATAQRPGAYLVHGHWGRKALSEANMLGLGRLIASSESTEFDQIPDPLSWNLPKSHAYFHIVSNETITGLQFQEWPVVEAPLVADMSSDIFSRPLPIDDFGVIYAGAQKNIGPSGISLVIVKNELLQDSNTDIPGIFSWRVQRGHSSRFNTPPTFAWYMADLVLGWIEAQGGVTALQQRNRNKARLIYSCIDESSLYYNRVPAGTRSLMNIPFVLRDEALNSRFLQQAELAGLVGLKGHKAVGGMRASIYNAMSESGVRALVDFMREFERSPA